MEQKGPTPCRKADDYHMLPVYNTTKALLKSCALEILAGLEKFLEIERKTDCFSLSLQPIQCSAWGIKHNKACTSLSMADFSELPIVEITVQPKKAGLDSKQIRAKLGSEFHRLCSTHISHCCHAWVKKAIVEPSVKENANQALYKMPAQERVLPRSMFKLKFTDVS